MLGCPLLLDAQTRIVVGCGACMRGQMINRAVRVHLDTLLNQMFSRCRVRRFERAALAIFPWRVLEVWTLEKTWERSSWHILGGQFGPSWHGAEFTRSTTGAC